MGIDLAFIRVGRVKEWSACSTNTAKQHNGVDPVGINSNHAQLPHSCLDDQW